MAQLSRMSLLVPVLTAVQKRVASTLSVPKVRARALVSLRISLTMWAARGSMPGLVDKASLGKGVKLTAPTRPPLAKLR